MSSKWEITRGRIKHDALEEVKGVLHAGRVEQAVVRAYRAMITMSTTPEARPCLRNKAQTLNGLTSKSYFSVKYILMQVR